MGLRRKPFVLGGLVRLKGDVGGFFVKKNQKRESKFRTGSQVIELSISPEVCHLVKSPTPTIATGRKVYRCQRQLTEVTGCGSEEVNRGLVHKVTTTSLRKAGALGIRLLQLSRASLQNTLECNCRPLFSERSGACTFNVFVKERGLTLWPAR